MFYLTNQIFTHLNRAQTALLFLIKKWTTVNLKSLNVKNNICFQLSNLLPKWQIKAEKLKTSTERGASLPWIVIQKCQRKSQRKDGQKRSVASFEGLRFTGAKQSACKSQQNSTSHCPKVCRGKLTRPSENKMTPSPEKVLGFSGCCRCRTAL